MMICWSEKMILPDSEEDACQAVLKSLSSILKGPAPLVRGAADQLLLDTDKAVGHGTRHPG